MDVQCFNSISEPSLGYYELIEWTLWCYYWLLHTEQYMDLVLDFLIYLLSTFINT